MESANVHQQTKNHPQDHRRRHHHPRQVVGSSSSSLAATSCYGVIGSSHSWTPNTILNLESFTSYPNGGNIINSTRVEQNQNLFPSWNIPMTTQEMGWTNVNPTGTRGTIKEEFSDNFKYPKFPEILTSSQSSSSVEDHFRLNPSAYNKNYNDDLSAKLLLRTISCVNEDFLQNPSNMDMNLQALDLLTASKFNGDFVRNDELGLYRQAGLCYVDHMQQSSQMPNNNKISDLNHGTAEAKRSTNPTLEPKAPKKSRVEPRSSCPPFKVRKEKLGDRIAALQQLVAPFGKTDTASVLMEAIGYIKFLQSQVETLSVPYMKSSRNKTTRPMQGVHESEDEETKRDLRRRGLCLVPLSSLSYVTDGGGGVVWPPPHFGGTT